MADEHPQRPGRNASDQNARRNWMVIGLAVAVVVLVGVVVFLIVDDSSDNSATSTTTTTTVPTTTVPPSTTTVPTSSTTVARPTTPEGYAQTLFTAWQTNNRALAAEVAAPAAVTQIFAHTFPQSTGGINPFTYQGCQGAAGSIICTWQGNGEVVVVNVRNLTGGLPIQVEYVQFQSKS